MYGLSTIKYLNDKETAGVKPKVINDVSQAFAIRNSSGE